MADPLDLGHGKKKQKETRKSCVQRREVKCGAVLRNFLCMTQFTALSCSVLYVQSMGWLWH